LLDECLKRRLMFFIGEGGRAIRNHDGVEIEHHGVTAGCLAADIGFRTGD